MAGPGHNLIKLILVRNSLHMMQSQPKLQEKDSFSNMLSGLIVLYRVLLQNAATIFS